MIELMEFFKDFGFPAIMCAVFIWYINKKDNDHREEVSGLTTAINEMRVVLARLLEHFGGDIE